MKDVNVCVLDFKSICRSCEECDICDLNEDFKCSNCMKCVLDEGASRYISVDEIKTDEKPRKGSDS
ncbi:hypothetical protein [Natranaerobius thermophilus]|uniref:Protein containing Zn-finger domain n=1 Tax=Natranaerobius thermophilus (strain ATCC BAA-1301 / DSM 18059 / JW/NM-WN-LF) TaxID=457570 RepID=B2A8H9_NATTJ|nr:hypothetical protein [Natranaerobius thermophilus]ACB85863.1 protein containing Zn-finger domain [Natranaerobius thermophilus JW/NM-WN-LF]